MNRRRLVNVLGTLTVVFVIAACIFYNRISSGEHHDSSLPAVELNALGFPDASRSGYNPILTKISYPKQKPEPPADYPIYEPLLTIIERWNPDVPETPLHFQETLQHFNYSNPYERSMAELYRNKEIPFKLYDVPNIEEVRNKWTNSYLSKEMIKVNPHVEKSKSNHFMFWNIQTQKRMRDAENYETPTEIVQMPFDQWVVQAQHADKDHISKEAEHYYFMMNSSPGRFETFVGRDLPIFSTRKNNFFITNVYANKGIQCRFGMRGIIAEAHYDQGRNMVAMCKGDKRYILTPPKTCSQLGIISDKKHPSFRHSVIDWSDPSQAKSHSFDKVDAIDTIVREGEVLYIPSFWFHYIISLSFSIQCNSRSGEPPNKEGRDEIDKCMGGYLNGKG